MVSHNRVDGARSNWFIILSLGLFVLSAIRLGVFLVQQRSSLPLTQDTLTTSANTQSTKNGHIPQFAAPTYIDSESLRALASGRPFVSAEKRSPNRAKTSTSGVGTTSSARVGEAVAISKTTQDVLPTEVAPPSGPPRVDTDPSHNPNRGGLGSGQSSRPEIAIQPQTYQTAFLLQGVAYSANGYVAVLKPRYTSPGTSETYVVRQGDVVGQEVVVSISRDSITLSRDEARVTLTVMLP